MTEGDRQDPRPTDLMAHRRRQGAILFLLLLGPAPISLILVLLGTSALSVTLVLVATAMLVGAMLELYRRQRRTARSCGLPLLPLPQVVALLGLVGGISAGTFLMPIERFASAGLAALLLVITVIYGLGIKLRRELLDLDERGLILVLGLMASLIALANSCV